MAELYYSPTLPSDWVVRHQGVLWLVPTRPHGWGERRPYRGHAESLRRVMTAGELDAILAMCGYEEEAVGHVLS